MSKRHGYRLFLFLCCALVCTGAQAQSAFSPDAAHTGAGALSCEIFTNADKRHDEYRSLALIWANGYVSAIDQKPADFDKNYVYGMTTLLVNECMKSPRLSIFEAVTQISDHLKRLTN